MALAGLDGFGSPPHAWGQYALVHRLHVIARFTPTCVGTIALRAAVGPSNAVHPHMRGDNFNLFSRRGIAGGSPPHAWGQSPDTFDTVCRQRFTPTCVGTMSRNLRLGFMFGVHPHMRGDNVPADMMKTAYDGSPPHAWGQCELAGFDELEIRFTPTCVGTMGLRHVQIQPGRFTPTCVGTYGGVPREQRRGGRFTPTCVGTIIRLTQIRSARDGSPPHAWGQLYRRREHRAGERFTPTCVGTIYAPATSRRRGTVHPHMRGDNTSRAWSVRLITGSPPHAWGQSTPVNIASVSHRFTPTCVGTMLQFLGGSLLCRFTPTCVGTMMRLTAFRRLGGGSPPHAWGQSLPSMASEVSLRFTPTCVGTILTFRFAH